MPPDIGPLSYRKVRRALRRLGFQDVRQTGSHVTFKHADGRILVVPRHDREELSPGFTRRMLKAGGVDIEEFLRRL